MNGACGMITSIDSVQNDVKQIFVEFEEERVGKIVKGKRGKYIPIELVCGSFNLGSRKGQKLRGYSFRCV